MSPTARPAGRRSAAAPATSRSPCARYGSLSTSLTPYSSSSAYHSPCSTTRATRTSPWGKRLKSALIWAVASAVVCGLVLGILYGLVGKVDFTVRHLSSSVQTFPNSFSGLSSGQPCFISLPRVGTWIIWRCCSWVRDKAADNITANLYSVKCQTP